MTDNEIKTALECLTGASKLCKEYGHYHFCRENCTKDALDLINRQQEKIKALEMDNAQLQSALVVFTNDFENATELLTREKEKVEEARLKVIAVCKKLKIARAEAIKEFAERLKKEMAYCSAETDEMIVFETEFDNLVKEMTEDKE